MAAVNVDNVIDGELLKLILPLLHSFHMHL